MRKYYTRACNFYHGRVAEKLVRSKKALPLNGKKNLAFDNVEIFIRDKHKVKSKLIHFKDVNKLSKRAKKTINKDLKKIISKRKNFLKHINFSKPSIMGVLNLTPDSFSDGGKFNKKHKSFKHISKMIQSGADIIDVGGESTRPGSETVDPKIEWKRVKNDTGTFKVKSKAADFVSGKKPSPSKPKPQIDSSKLLPGKGGALSADIQPEEEDETGDFLRTVVAPSLDKIEKSLENILNFFKI